MFVKVCGMTTAAAVDAAVLAGVDAIGFVFAESPREVSPEAAKALCRSVPEYVLRVAVMHHPQVDRAAQVLATFEPDWLQTDAEDFDYLDLPDGVESLPVYRDGGASPVPAGTLRLLFEGRSSGMGTTADWRQARGLAARTNLILAGGLDAGNVAEAISLVRPWGVDVSSGVERARGEKDPEKIADFVARVRTLEDEL